jgi:hypothetical protein
MKNWNEEPRDTGSEDGYALGMIPYRGRPIVAGTRGGALKRAYVSGGAQRPVGRSGANNRAGKQHGRFL